MRARVFLPVFLFAVALPILAGEEKTKEKKEDAIKVDLSYLEKTWGIKCKSHKITPPEPIFEDVPAGIKTKKGGVTKGGREQRGTSPAEVKFLLEFTKDVENLKELRAEFTPAVKNQRPGNPPTQTWPLWLYFFDEENVFVGKVPMSDEWRGDASAWIDGRFHARVSSMEGEITGKKGDAIRIFLLIDSKSFKKTRKIEARPLEKEKTKDEAKKGK